MTAFQKRVARVVARIRRGTTMSYGEVAARAGRPGAPRAVVAALHHLDVPWWRVARHDGTLAPQVAHLQATLLRQEGWQPPAQRKNKRSPRRR
jgi:methylated-DNA-protein-cysteine methyltransferase-like protein